MGCPPWVIPCRGSMANCITLDRTVMAPTAKSPPYFKREELKQSTNRLSVACMTKGETPRAMQGKNTFALILKYFFLRWSTVFFPQRN